MFNKIKCEGNKVIVPVEEEISLTVCNTNGNPYGIEVDISGEFNKVTAKSDEFKKDSLNVIYVSGGIGKGESLNTAVNQKVYLKTYLDCSDYINKEDLKDENKVKETIRSCIIAKYKTDVEWKLVLFNKEQLDKTVQYTYKQDLGSYSSNRFTRRIDTNFPSKCLSTTTSQETTQQLIVKVDCSDPNDPRVLDDSAISVPEDSLKTGCFSCKSGDLNVIIENGKISKVSCAN